MAGTIPDLIAEARVGTGKGAAREARRTNYVPGIVYGGGQDPLPLNIKYFYLTKLLSKGRFLSTLFNLKVEGQEDVRVICRAVQRNVVKDTPIHVDLVRLRRTSRIKLFIQVEFENHEQAPGLKRGGALTVVRSEVEFEVTAGDIPESIVVDLTGLEIGDVVNINDVKLPKGVKAVIDRNFVIANLAAPSALRSSGDDEAEEEVSEDSAEE